MLSSLDELAERMPSLLDIDHPCAQKHIEEARRMVEVCTKAAQMHNSHFKLSNLCRMYLFVVINVFIFIGQDCY